MKQKRWNIKKRIMAGFVIVLAVVSVVVTLLFRQTENTLRVEYRKLVQSSVEGAMHRLDMLIREVYSISDNFAFNNQLENYLDKTYTEEQVHLKRADVIRMYRNYFEASDILQKRQKISGILTTKGVLFNFEDVNCDGQEVTDQLLALGINKPEHLMRFCWYSLRDNFMVQDATGDVRRDKAVFGSRRVYSVWKSAYICTHIFCIREEDLYEAYQESVVETKGEIYILDEDGNLISSSNQECVKRGAVDEIFRKEILNRTEDDFTWNTRTEKFEICVRQSELNKWMTVAVIPQKNITGEVNALYRRIYVVLILCLIGCVVVLMRMYQGFFTPVNELNQAMREVQMGNLNAYVKETGRNEIADMMRYYNNMLRSIHVHVVEKLESERRKKELELEVLVSQINPHFLYNP
ncbi:MAG: HAMP domain-containing protein, partial [Lachnospiraceae bacterium]|nr:HAMP domain-containing protein [Lachnospiraceae bacterium]